MIVKAFEEIVVLFGGRLQLRMATSLACRGSRQGGPARRPTSNQCYCSMAFLV